MGAIIAQIASLAVAEIVFQRAGSPIGIRFTRA